MRRRPWHVYKWFVSLDLTFGICSNFSQPSSRWKINGNPIEWINDQYRHTQSGTEEACIFQGPPSHLHFLRDLHIQVYVPFFGRKKIFQTDDEERKELDDVRIDKIDWRFDPVVEVSMASTVLPNGMSIWWWWSMAALHPPVTSHSTPRFTIGPGNRLFKKCCCSCHALPCPFP